MDLQRVVEDDAERAAAAGAERADAVAQLAAMNAARAFRRPFAHREDDRLALGDRHDLRAGLLARPLLDQYELAAGAKFCPECGTKTEGA